MSYYSHRDYHYRVLCVVCCVLCVEFLPGTLTKENTKSE